MNKRKTVDRLNGKVNIIGKSLNTFREEHKISRQVLSNKLMLLGIDLSAQSIYDIEMGVRTVTDYELCAIAKVLKIDFDFLIKDFIDYIDKIFKD